MSPTNYADMLTIVVDLLVDDQFIQQFGKADFIMTDVYQKSKQNLAVPNFVRRAGERGIEMQPGERFSYVIKKPSSQYDHRNKLIHYKKGDLMEFPEDVDLNDIYTSFYIEHYLVGPCARLINYAPQFSQLDDGLAQRQAKKISRAYT